MYKIRAPLDGGYGGVGLTHATARRNPASLASWWKVLSRTITCLPTSTKVSMGPMPWLSMLVFIASVIIRLWSCQLSIFEHEQIEYSLASPEIKFTYIYSMFRLTWSVLYSFLWDFGDNDRIKFIFERGIWILSDTSGRSRIDIGYRPFTRPFWVVIFGRGDTFRCLVFWLAHWQFVKVPSNLFPHWKNVCIVSKFLTELLLPPLVGYHKPHSSTT